MPDSVDERQVDTVLDPLYKNPGATACFTSTEPLWRAAHQASSSPSGANNKNDIGWLTRVHVRAYLARQRVYTLHRRVVRRFPRLATLACGLHTDWQADLADMQRLKKWNRGQGYLLVCIDTLSRQLFVEPVKSKHSEHIIGAFGRVFSRCGYKPWRLLTDSGREFTAQSVQAFLRDNDVKHFCMFTSPLWHAGMAERANRTIKERLYRYFTHRGTRCWVQVIQRIVQALNRSPCRSIFGLRPIDVTFATAERLRRRLQRHAEQQRLPKRAPRFHVGDEVRVEKRRHVFRKGYLPTFTDEVFTVARVRTTPAPITYRLRNEPDGKMLPGWFYTQELCLVRDTARVNPASTARSRIKKIATTTTTSPSSSSPIYEIERIIQRKYRDSVEYSLVKWKGYAAKHNSWIPATSII
jgi:hypothetical protein